MRQWTTLMDGIDNFRIQDVTQPHEIGEDEVLVKISNISLNYRDIKLINGDFKGRYAESSTPLVPASDASGTIAALSSHNTKTMQAQGWQVGDRVFNLVRPTHLTGPTRAEHHAIGVGIPQPGVLSEYRIFKKSALVAVPEYMNLREACTLPIAAITAWMALNWDCPLNQPRTGPDVTVLLQGTGGVSISALQQAHTLGLKTIITSSSDEKLTRAKGLGASHTINYKTCPDWAEEVLRLTDGKGADVIVETGGPGTMKQSLKAVAEGGVISAVGILTGTSADDQDKDQMSVGLSLINRNATLKGINIGPKDRMEEMLRFYDENKIHPVVDRVFAFEQVRDALHNLQRGSHFGKIVVEVDQV